MGTNGVEWEKVWALMGGTLWMRLTFACVHWLKITVLPTSAVVVVVADAALPCCNVYLGVLLYGVLGNAFKKSLVFMENSF